MKENRDIWCIREKMVDLGKNAAELINSLEDKKVEYIKIGKDVSGIDRELDIMIDLIMDIDRIVYK